MKAVSRAHQGTLGQVWTNLFVYCDGQGGYLTNDLKSLQAVHGLDFEDYGVQPICRGSASFIGEEVFNMDGPFWQHSRSLLRPICMSSIMNLYEWHILLHEMAKQTGDRDELRNQIIQVSPAGHGSSAITIRNAMFHTCRYSGKLAKLRKEVSSFVRSRTNFRGIQRYALSTVCH